uniref:ATP synthase complex subunit 8 n=1 Tax=Hydrotaea dentipes TaxID=559648 RepID=A0A6H0ELD1_9MUSC|nr:ATP synthase F0 subunit 8 [Hydrotaea dentipes]QIT03198.1 ATP synthase F0 subunit 8 [Hydrotaea dentipes]
MPQMAPIAWLSLFIIFSITFVIFNMVNYYSYNPIMPKSMPNNNLYKMNSLNWKW